MPRPKYPHLLPEDAAVWDTFHEQLGPVYEKFEYDVQVGGGRPAPDAEMPGIRKMADDLSRRRIDVVGFQSDALTIFEVTHTVGFTAIGQYLAYPALYQLTLEPNLPLKAALVTSRIETDLPEILLAFGIVTYVCNPQTRSVLTLNTLFDLGRDIPGPGITEAP